jgi:outer membrane protein OmpA-like peptidoglycan-associated protein
VVVLVAAGVGADALAQSRVRRSIDGPVTRESIVRSLAIVPATAGDRDAPAEVSVMLRIGFDFDSARLTAASMLDLDRVAEALVDREMAGVPVTLEGHTDATGEAGYNLALSRRRAAAVVDYLVERGIARGRLRPVGYGEDRLLRAHAPNDDRQRRVEIVRTF